MLNFILWFWLHGSVQHALSKGVQAADVELERSAAAELVEDWPEFVQHPGCFLLPLLAREPEHPQGDMEESAGHAALRQVLEIE